jgi:hypothetical protein
MPGIPSMPGGMQFVTGKACSNCNKEVPSHIGVGDSCPHCGVEFDYDETTGEKSSSSSFRVRGRSIKGIIVLVVLVLSGLAALGRKMFG